MEAFQQRVVDEQAELDEKRDKLGQFIGGYVFNGLPEAERERLVRQKSCMDEYSGILGERIAAFALLESGGMMNDIEHESRCRIADAKCVLSQALAEYKPEGLTEMEAAVAFFEQAQYWLMESWQTDCNADSNGSLEPLAKKDG